MKQPRKTVLVIARSFPPLGGAAVVRVAKFVKYLPEFGWRPIVLTIEERYYHPRLLDRDLLKDLPRDTLVYRTPAFLRPKTASSTLSGDRRTQAAGMRSRGAVMRALRGVLPFEEGFPWLPFALPAIRHIARKEGFDVILSSSPPHNAHVIAAMAKLFWHKPWVADFRDGWIDDSNFHTSAFPRAMLERWMESWIVHSADRVVCAWDQIQDWFVERHGEGLAQKALVLYNGYDPAESPPSGGGSYSRPEVAETSEMRVVFTGSIRRTQAAALRCLLAASRDLALAGEIPADRLRLEFVGLFDEDLLSQARASAGIEVIPPVPRHEALRRMQEADVLLLATTLPRRNEVPAKFYEYLQARRPILALFKRGTVSRWIEDENLGLVADPEDPEAIKSALRELYRRFGEGTLDRFGASEAFLTQFDRRRQAEQLAHILDEIVAAREVAGG